MIRYANFADAPAVAAIYAHYVHKTAITFVAEAPTRADFVSRISDPRYPFFVAEKNDRVVGYAYASMFRTKAAYRWDVEVSIYLAPGIEGQGIGSELMEALLAAVEKQGYLNAYSCITMPNDRSVALHRKFGFEELGRFPRSGYKHGKWHDVIWMGRPLAELEDQGEDPEEPRLLV